MNAAMMTYTNRNGVTASRVASHGVTARASGGSARSTGSARPNGKRARSVVPVERKIGRDMAARNTRSRADEFVANDDVVGWMVSSLVAGAFAVIVRTAVSGVS